MATTGRAAKKIGNKAPIRPYVETIVDHLREAAEELSAEELEGFVEALQSGKRIFVMGAGRSGLVAKAFAMRLMHLGFTTFVVGETTTPALDKYDTVVAITGSGRTRSILELGKTAKELGARLALVTSRRDSPMAEMATALLVVKGPPSRAQTPADYEKRQLRGEYRSLAPLGTLFETAAMVVLDGVIAHLMERKGISEKELKARHAVLE